MTDRYEVIISRSPSCSCPYFQTRAKNTTQICKHIIWVYIKVLNISQDNDLTQQTALKPEELRTIVEQAPEVFSELAGIPPSHFTSSCTDANHRVSTSSFKPTNTLTSTVTGYSTFEATAENRTNENRLDSKSRSNEHVLRSVIWRLQSIIVLYNHSNTSVIYNNPKPSPDSNCLSRESLISRDFGLQSTTFRLSLATRQYESLSHQI